MTLEAVESAQNLTERGHLTANDIPVDVADDVLEEKAKRGCCSRCLHNKVTQAILRFIFSNVGMCIIILIYTVLGGFLFQVIELGEEKDTANTTRTLAQAIEDRRAELHPEIIALANANAGLNRTDTVRIFKQWLNDYQAMIIEAIDAGYDGTVHDPDEEQYKWDTASAILFTASILTTIGYGHVAPKTQLGQLVTILYSLLAIPLMTMFLLNIGAAVANSVRFAYKRGCCFFCWRKRERTHGRWESKETRKAKRMAKKDKVEDAEKGGSVKAWHGSDPKENEMPEADQQLIEEMPDPEDVDENTEVPHSLTIFILLLFLILGTVVFSIWSTKDDHWSIVNSMYFCWTTLYTIGFGDLVPGIKDIHTISGQMRMAFAALYIILGLAILGATVDLITEAIAKGAAKAAEAAARLKKKEEDDKIQFEKDEAQKALNGNQAMDAVSMSKAGDDMTPPIPVQS